MVYAAFSAGMVAGVWRQIDLGSLLLVLAADLVLLGAVLSVNVLGSRVAGFSKEDEITIVFCGSKKSMAGGIPMANILFPGHAVGLIVLPLMLFHQAQLFACAALAQRYAHRTTVKSQGDPAAVAAKDSRVEQEKRPVSLHLSKRARPVPRSARKPVEVMIARLHPGGNLFR